PLSTDTVMLTPNPPSGFGVAWMLVGAGGRGTPPPASRVIQPMPMPMPMVTGGSLVGGDVAGRGVACVDGHDGPVDVLACLDVDNRVVDSGVVVHREIARRADAQPPRREGHVADRGRECGDKRLVAAGGRDGDAGAGRVREMIAHAGSSGLVAAPYPKWRRGVKITAQAPCR